MLRQIKLYGLAAKTFGPSFELDVASLAEATRALSVQIKGFREFIEKHNFRIVCGSTLKKGWQLGEAEVSFRLPDGDIHIMPALKGAKRGGIGKIIAGVVLLAAAFFIPMIPSVLAGGSALGAALGGTTYVGSVGFIGSLASAGVGLIVGGVSQLMTKTAKPSGESKDDKSFTIDGNLNVQEQGGPVPLIYGLYRVGSTLISAGISTAEYSASVAGSVGTTPVGTKAAGSVNFVNKAVAGDIVALNGLAFTFVDAPAFRGQVAIGTSLSASIDNLINAIYAIEDIRVAGASYDHIGNGLRITFKTPGAVGNGYSMVVSSAVISLSGGSLVGGAD